MYPYAELAAPDGTALPLTRDYRAAFTDTAGGGKLLDWHYYPLEDYKHATDRQHGSDLFASAGASYEILPGLEASVQYQYQRTDGSDKQLYDGQSYFARNLVNLFTQVDDASGAIAYPVPKGGVLDLAHSETTANNVRGQLNYKGGWGDHLLTALAGWETRETRGNSDRNRTYGYDDDLLTYTQVDYIGYYRLYNSGYVTTIPANTSFSGTLNRFVSGYGNAAYSYRNRYTVSGSVRKDASNLFGVESNRKGIPLWSAGAGWDLSKEPFYHARWLSLLKLRATYGWAGTADPSRSAVATMVYIPDDWITHLNYGNLNQPANPNLSWERTQTVNAGIDFATRSGWLSGNIDLYLKNGKDLFGPTLIDITTGLQRPTLTKNIASMRGRGIEADWRIRPLNKKVVWQMNLLFNYNLSKVKDYTVTADVGDYYVGSPSVTPIPGKSVYSLLSYRWGGLDSLTGDPVGYLEGKRSTDYAAITGQTKIADLKYAGPSAPPVYGSLINSVSVAGFTLTLNVSYKLGYYYRKPSVNYYRLFYGWNGHTDYELRWQKPGDENTTSVPSLVYPANSLRDRFYQYSDVLVRRGDNIRLQYVNMEYLLTKKAWKRMPFASARLYLYGSNLGMLWKAEKGKPDPDYPSSLRPARAYTAGISLEL